MKCWDGESQPIVMWTPSFIDVIKSMRDPLLFKNFVSFLTNVERLASPRIKKGRNILKVIEYNEDFTRFSNRFSMAKMSHSNLVYFIFP